MNNISSVKSILCYGDSNTWGYIPSTGAVKRYSREIRWTGRLQHLLGSDYYVVEEGLNGRTTNLDYPIPPDRNGKTYLSPCLYTHAPIDVVILFLGGNDLKFCFNRSAEEICGGLSQLIDIIKSSVYGKNMVCSPEVLVVSQPIPRASCEKFSDEGGMKIFDGAIDKATKLTSLYQNLAGEKSCYFIDTSEEIFSSNIDGMHLDEAGHGLLSQILYEKIIEVFN
jgi:lysophospholipase L1-like esterase